MNLISSVWFYFVYYATLGDIGPVKRCIHVLMHLLKYYRSHSLLVISYIRYEETESF